MSRAKRSGHRYPTVEEINAAPPKWRDYIHELVSRTDKTGDVQTIAYLREDCEALQRRVEELAVEVAELRAKINSVP